MCLTGDFAGLEGHLVAAVGKSLFDRVQEEILSGDAQIKKTLIADYLAENLVNRVFDTPNLYSGAQALIAVYAYSLQLYFDFSGYTDIARGCARLLGFKFPSNFERPYLSADIGEFWRRWHISLSSWLRDYLYIPLGGNRRGEMRTCINLMIVMGLGGLWHGASWNFAVWGIFHGTLLIVHRYWRRFVTAAGLAQKVDAPMLRPLWVALTFVLVTIGWVPFRAPDFASTWNTLRALASVPDMRLVWAHPAIVAIPLAALAFCLLDRERRWQNWLTQRAGFATAVGATAAALIALEIFGQVEAQIPFVYFQF